MKVRGIIVAHSVLSNALKSTVEQIAGPQEDIISLSNESFSNEELESQLRRILEDQQPTVIFTDFVGGSPFAVARLVVSSYGKTGQYHCAAITGVNLPMMISFVTKRNNLSFPALVETLREDGHRGIQ